MSEPTPGRTPSPHPLLSDATWNALVVAAYQQISKECPVWEADFPAGPGLVVSVMDAAVVAARMALGARLEAS